jgi:RND family efflux transporter MFP subunit
MRVMQGPPDSSGRSRGAEMDAVYTQLAQSAARLMVVHEASHILRSSHDPEGLAKGLLDTIAEALFAGSGCVARLENDELKILAARRLTPEEVEALAANAREAAVWFAVADGEEPRTRESLAEELGLADAGEEEASSFEDEDSGSAEDEDADFTGPDLAQDEEGPPESAEEEAGLEDDAGPEDDAWSPDDEPSESEGSGIDDTEDEPFSADDDDEDVQPDDLAEAEEGAGARSGPVFELYLPLRVEDQTLGVLALGKRVDGRAYQEEDRQFALSLSTHLALALDHAALFAERNARIEKLSVLLRISREITSSLDLDRVLNTIAHMIQLVLPNRRTTVALILGDSVAIRASSDPGFKVKQAAQDPFLPILRWVHGSHQTTNTCRSDLEADEEAAGRDLLLPWLSAEGGPAGLAVMPLEDDQGVLGLLSIETDTDAPPLDADQEELVSILANQTTVAIRNAELYQRVPMISVLEPFLARLKRARSLSRSAWLVRGAIAAAVLIAGFALPLPSWVSGSAWVKPARPVALRAGTEGTVEEVLVVEGQAVTQGEVVARMRRDELEIDLEEVRAAGQEAKAEAARARSQGDLSTYRARQAKLNELYEREKYLETELGRTELTVPTSGVVLTPNIERRRGEHLRRGEALLEVADFTTMEIEISLAGHDLERVSIGQPARLKVHAYPQRTFRGQVVRIAPAADRDGSFRVTVGLPNADGALRPGMTGRAHVEVPARPVLASFLAPVLRRARLALWI